jgi:glucose/arabinose dehydrogenase
VHPLQPRRLAPPASDSARSPESRDRRRAPRATWIAFLGALVLGLSAAACTAPTGSVAPAPVPTSSPSIGSAASAPTSSPVALAHLSVSLTRRWSGFDAPVYVTNAGDGSNRLFVVEQPGRIRVIRDGQLVARPYLDIGPRVTYGGEQGLLGLAFSPGFASNGRFYVDYVDLSGDTIIAEGTARDPASDAPGITALRTILRVDQPPYPNHKGGCLQFGPDGYLYVGMGDGGSAGDPGDRAQNPRVLLGKLLRIDPEHATGSRGYAIPSGQPMRAGWAPEVFAIGLRNPWRFSFDASTGALWIGDVGQDAWEEIDVAPKGVGGQNWGWNRWEGLHPYGSQSPARRASYAFPVAEYPHPDGESITGGYVYRGSKYPSLAGTYLYADFENGWLSGLRATTPNGRPMAKPDTRTLLTSIGQPSSFGIDESGELYLVDYRGSILQIRARAQ